MPPGDRRSTISTCKEGIQPAPLPAFIFHSKAHSDLLLQPLSAPVWLHGAQTRSTRAGSWQAQTRPPAPPGSAITSFWRRNQEVLTCRKVAKTWAREKLPSLSGSLQGWLSPAALPAIPTSSLGRAGRSRLAPFHLLLPWQPFPGKKALPKPFPYFTRQVSHPVTISWCHGPHQWCCPASQGWQQQVLGSHS